MERRAELLLVQRTQIRAGEGVFKKFLEIAYLEKTVDSPNFFFFLLSR